jgi:hypothetical protein
MAEPSGSYNITQHLFKLDESIVNSASQKPGQATPTTNFGPQFDSFINQSRLSTYFQDNPWPTVTFAQQFGVAALGGRVNPTLTPGGRPGNLLATDNANVTSGNAPMPANAFVGSEPLTYVNGMYVPKNMAINFPKNQNKN